MITILARKLIAKGAIRQETVFQATHSAAGLAGARASLVSGNFVLIAARGLKDGSIAFDCLRAGTTEQVRLLSTEVVGVDGMCIERFAGTYDLNEDGSDKKVGKRRGRRPRALVEAMARQAAALAAAQEAEQLAIHQAEPSPPEPETVLDTVADAVPATSNDPVVVAAEGEMFATSPPMLIIAGSARPMLLPRTDDVDGLLPVQIASLACMELVR